VHGRIERIDSEQIVFSFEMPADSEAGTPTVTLVAPGKAIDINGLTLDRVNGAAHTSLDTQEGQQPMFFDPSPDPDVKIDGIEVFRSPDESKLTALASGKGFDKAREVFVNGVPAPPGVVVSKTLIRAEIPTPPDETVQVVFTTGERTVKSKAVPNPAYVKINKDRAPRPI
jgi:hypothetical protein